MLKTEFESAIPASERPQTQTLARAATGTNCKGLKQFNIPGAISYPRKQNHSINSMCFIANILLSVKT